MLEWGGIITISNVKVPLEVIQNEEIDLSELDIELEFDESNFMMIRETSLLPINSLGSFDFYVRKL